MNDMYQKLCLIIGEILCFSSKVCWASAPIFDHDTDSIFINFKDHNNNTIALAVSYNELSKVHDHSLEMMIFEIMRSYDLL